MFYDSTDLYHVNVINALELANQSVHDMGYNHNPYNNKFEWPLVYLIWLIGIDKDLPDDAVLRQIFHGCHIFKRRKKYYVKYFI